MPAPAMISRHLYTGHRRGHIQPAPRLRAHRSEPLSQDHPQIPVSMPIVVSFRCVSSGSHMFVFSSHTRPAHSETSTAALTIPALDRRSLRWFGISAPTATPQDPPPSLAQHGSCRRSSTSSSLPFRTHVGAENSAVVVDLSRCGPMLNPRVPHHVPIPGPRMERETPGQRPRPNYGHPHPQRAHPAGTSVLWTVWPCCFRLSACRTGHSPTRSRGRRPARSWFACWGRCRNGAEAGLCGVGCSDGWIMLLPCPSGRSPPLGQGCGSRVCETKRFWL